MPKGRKLKTPGTQRTKLVTLSLTPVEYEAVKKAADGRPLAAWLRIHAFLSAGLTNM